MTYYSLVMSASNQSLPIGVLEPQDFLYLSHYAPNLAPRLFLLSPNKDDFFYKGFRLFSRWCPMKLNPTSTYQDFSDANNHIYIYGAKQIAGLANLTQGSGRTITFFEMSNERFLAKLEKNSSAK